MRPNGRQRLAAARSRRGSDMPPAYHSLPRRHFVTPYTREPVGWGDGWLVVGISHNCYNIIQKRYVEKKIFLCNSQLNVTCAKSIIFIYILHK